MLVQIRLAQLSDSQFLARQSVSRPLRRANRCTHAGSDTVGCQ